MVFVCPSAAARGEVYRFYEVRIFVWCGGELYCGTEDVKIPGKVPA